jgi:6-phosphogluconate dehydrogenase (decarboxylating)
MNDLNILAVSSDKGWSRYADTSKRIDVIDNLADALAHFQPHNFAKNIIDSIKSDYVSGESNEIFDSIAEGIADSLDGIDILIEASSSFYFEEEDVHAVYGNHELYCDATVSGFLFGRSGQAVY